MEDTDIEEGEACYYKDDARIDPDIALSYIGEKLQSVLGHFQKDFEGGFSAENLGAKFGGYGSFLPTYQRSPSISQPKVPQRVQNFSSPRSANVLHVEGTPQNSSALSDAARSPRIGPASCLSSTGNVSAKQDSCSSSAQVIEKLPLKHKPFSNKPVNPTGQRTLKVRIKVGSSGKVARKNAAIYSGLGLISPSSSTGNSLEESGGMPSECLETLDESPNSILQTMTSFSIPGGFLLSPLHETFLCLARKKKHSKNNKPVLVIKNGQQHSALLADDSAFQQGSRKMPEETKKNTVEKDVNLEELRQEICLDYDNNRAILGKQVIAIAARNMEKDTVDRNQCFSNDTKLKPLSNSVCNVGNSVEVTNVAHGVPREAERGASMKERDVVKDGMEDRLSIGLVKESLESISDQEGGKCDKVEMRSRSVEKICGNRLRNSQTDVSTHCKEDDQNKCNKDSALFKNDSDVSKCKRDSNMKARYLPKHNIGQEATCHKQDEINIPYGVERSSFEGKKKSKRGQSNSMLASIAAESMMSEVFEAPEEKKKAGKRHGSKSQKDIIKVCDNSREVLPETRVEQMNKQMDLLERPFGDMAKDSKLAAVEKEQCAFFDKSKDVSTYNKIDNRLTSGKLLKEAANVKEHNLMDPMVIEEDWVCCDRCQKWRLLPYGTKPEQLPEKWLCSMLNWLPKMNECDISEEETTKALHALYQLPESQNNLQNHVDRNAAGVSSADVWHFDQNHQNLSSHTIPNSRKKKQGSKETPHLANNGGLIQISGSTKTFQQEPVRSRSLNDMNQPMLQFNLSNSSVQHLNESCNFSVEKINHKQKEKHVNSGDANRKKLKSKREANQHGCRTPKKIKADVASDTDKCWTTDHSGNLNKIAYGSGGGLPMKVLFKSVGKQNEHYYPKDTRSDRKEKVQISAKKQGECALVSLHTGSMDIKTNDEREIMSLKKRKLKDWQESQNCVETSRNNGNLLLDRKVFIKESSSESEFRKAKKSRLSRTEGMEFTESKDDDRLNKKGKVARILLSSGRENPVNGKEEVRSIDKDQQLRKQKIKLASDPAFDDINSLKRDLGSGQFSMEATSSSSKVSDSRKSKVHFPEVKGSPVKSVSSSPMQTTDLDKFLPARRGILGNCAVRNDDFPMMDSPKKSLDGEGNDESNLSRTARRGKVSGISHLESVGGCPVIDFQDNKVSKKLGGKSKTSFKPFSEGQNGHLVCNDPRDLHASDHCHNVDRMIKSHDNDYASFPQKSGKVSSLQLKDKNRSSGCHFKRVKVKVSDPPSGMEVLNMKQSPKGAVETGLHNLASLNEESSDMECKVKPDKKSVASRGSENWASDRTRDNYSKFVEHDGSVVKLGAVCRTDDGVIPQQNLIQDFHGEVSKKSNPTQLSSGCNSQTFLCHTGKQDQLAHVPQPVSGLQKGSAFNAIPVGSSGNGNLSKLLKQPTNDVNHLGYPMPNRCGPSPLSKDASSHVASSALKEAEDLRDYADRLKDSGFGFEYKEAYFQAALKFLHAASLLETCNVDSCKQGEISHIQIYINTANLCETCAHEYEKHQEMAAAALVYKCMEVAYMRIVNCKISIANRDRYDLQANLQTIPQGESPSSSASDVDNFNSHAMADKVALSKGLGAHAGNHVIVARSRPNFVRLLDFTKDVNSAMEATRKSQNAFAAANVILEEAWNKESIVSVKRVIDFSFQDVEELIRLTRLAIEAISRQGFSGSRD